MDSDRRKLLARWTITATLHLESASQIGSHESDYGDQTFARTSEGRIPLHGSTLGGALRSALADRTRGYRQAELNIDEKRSPDNPLQHLFGNEKLHESPLIVFDSVSRDRANPAMRDGVRIDAATGTAEEKGKYDREVAQGGAVFDLRFDLLVDAPVEEPKKHGVGHPGDDKGKEPKRPNEAELLAHLVAALDALKAGQVRFGARKSRGLGLSRANQFRARRYDLLDPKGWLEYAGSPCRMADLHKEMESRPDCAEPSRAILQELGDESETAHELRSKLRALTEAEAYRKLLLDFDVAVVSTVMIRSAGIKAGSSDVKHLTESGTPLLSGTSLAGSLRAEAVRILNTLRPPESDNKNREIITRLFGDAPKAGRPYGSRLLLTEAAITKSSTYRQTRIKIDRLTGGVLDGALLEEEPAAGGRVRFIVEILDPSDVEIGLALLAARELAGAWRPVGGEAAVGRGLLNGNVAVALPDGRELSMPPGGFAQKEAEQVQQYVTALRKELGVPT